MTPSGPYPPGGGPQDADGERSENEDEALFASDDAVLDEEKGWIPPEHRTWRHPSEVFAGLTAHGAPAAGDDSNWLPGKVEDPHERAGRGSGTAWATALIGVGATAIVLLGALMLTAPEGSPGTSGVPLVLSLPTSVASMEQAERSMVALKVTKSSGTAIGCGVAVASGGLVATTADALLGATSVNALASDGHWTKATVVAIDPGSDIGLVRVPYQVPVARFVDESSVRGGLRAWMLAMTPRLVGSGSSIARWPLTPGVVRSSGTAINGGMASGMAGVVATVPLVSNVTGEALMRQDGAVIGILDTSSTPNEGEDQVFLPAEFVVGVSQDLKAGGRIRHGWLDINGSDSPVQGSSPGSSNPGAIVTDVGAEGPAGAVLRQGDVIEAVNGNPVTSMADLRSRLYVLAPGTEVYLLIERASSMATVAVDLASSP